MSDFNVRDHGALGDGRHLDTQAVQAAIDAAHTAGGGRVLVPGGCTCRCGTIVLKGHVELHLATGGSIVASEDPTDYIQTSVAGEYGGAEGGFLISAEAADGVAISGHGSIDGRGISFMDGFRSDDGPWIRKPKDWRPRGIGLTACNGVRLTGFTIRDAAQWTVHLTGCEDVLIDGITIKNRLDIPNNDGIDPDHCRNIRIVNCHIEAGDDGIVLKNTKGSEQYGPTENVVIANCSIVSTSAAIKIGTESIDDFRNIVITGCVIDRSHRGIAVQLRDHGALQGLVVSDCVVRTRHFNDWWWGQAEAIYLTALPRHDGITPGGIRDVSVRGLRCHGENGIVVMGTAEVPVEDLHIADCSVIIEQSSRWPGGKLDRRPAGGSEHGGLEEAPCPAIYCEHLTHSSIDRCRVAWRGERQAWWGEACQLKHCTLDRCEIDEA